MFVKSIYSFFLSDKRPSVQYTWLKYKGRISNKEIDKEKSVVSKKGYFIFYKAGLNV